MRHSLAVLACAAALLACSGNGPVVRSEPNPVRRGLEEAVAALDPARSLELRYNPASCGCPPFELRLGDRWIRAELSGGDSERLPAWLAFMATTPVERLPRAVAASGRVDRELVRTATGSYAVRIELGEVLDPLEPQPAPAAEAPAEAAQPQPE